MNFVTIFGVLIRECDIDFLYVDEPGVVDEMLGIKYRLILVTKSKEEIVLTSDSKLNVVLAELDNVKETLGQRANNRVIVEKLWFK